MSYFKVIFIIIAFTFSNHSFADNKWVAKEYINDYSGTDIVFEAFARTTALFVGLPVGAAIFAASSPFTGLLTLIKPHNTIQKSLDYMVLTPVKYIAIRPIADWDHSLYGRWEE